MASLLDRCGVACATTLTGTLTLGAALGATAPNLCSFMDLPTAGAVDQKTYRYLILDSNGAWELGKGVFTLAGLTLTRTVQFSSNSNAAISLTGSSQVFISPLAEDIVSISDDQTALFTQTEKAQHRVNSAAAPIEALASNVLNLNAGMEISQEIGGAAVTLTGTASLQTKYVVDGVMGAYRGSFVVNAAQVTDAPTGFKNSVKLVVITAEASVGANDELGVLIPIEGVRCTKLGFGAATASAIAIFFWTKVHRTGVYSASLRNGAKTRSYPFNFTVNVADTWEYKSIVIQGDQTGTWAIDTTVGLYLNICIAAGSSRVGSANAWAGADASGVTSTVNGVAATTDVFQVTGVGSLPLVAGVTIGDIPDSAHSPFLVRAFDDEILRCRRHYRKSYDYGTVPGVAARVGLVGGPYFTSPSNYDGPTFSFGQIMRADPSISYWDGAGGASKVSGLTGATWTDGVSVVPTITAGMEGFVFAATASGPTGNSLYLQFVADARL